MIDLAKADPVIWPCRGDTTNAHTTTATNGKMACKWPGSVTAASSRGDWWRKSGGYQKEWTALLNMSNARRMIEHVKCIALIYRSAYATSKKELAACKKDTRMAWLTDG